MRKLGASRREFFESIDRPALLPLPAEPYQYAEWRRARVAPDYHVEVQGHFYSVPSRLIRQIIEVRITEQTAEMFHRGVRVASHARSPVKHRHTTIPEHMPSAHRRYAFWTPARLLAAAEQIGPSTVALCEAIMRAKAPSSTSATASASGPAPAPRRWRSRRPGVSTARPASRAHAFRGSSPGLIRRMHARQRHARTGGAAVQPFPKMTAETKENVVSAIGAINTSHQHRYG
jgi:hypothetical protein